MVVNDCSVTRITALEFRDKYDSDFENNFHIDLKNNLQVFETDS